MARISLASMITARPFLWYHATLNQQLHPVDGFVCLLFDDAQFGDDV
ncbi:MAG TPA: hypothetical protein VMO17_14605 [Terriglobia bacterium]|nr:hypothetical protein [Terriglobia bacterium]